jgi:hypothetical protein
MSFHGREKQRATKFLAKQRDAWIHEMSKYYGFSFVLGIRLNRKTSRNVISETFWCGDQSICEDMTQQTMFGPPVEHHVVDDVYEEPFTVPPEDYEYPGYEEWLNRDLSPKYHNVYDLATKARTLIKFAWWQEYKTTRYGVEKQPYKCVKREPHLLFPWWNIVFPDIPFDTYEVGRLDNAKRIVDYIHKRYVLKDPSVYEDVSSHTVAVEQPSQPSHRPVSMHDIDILVSSMVPMYDPIHILKHQPIVYDMAQYQKDNNASRLDTYTHFEMHVSQEWRDWAASTGEAIWSTIVEKQLAFHASRSNEVVPVPVAPVPVAPVPETVIPETEYRSPQPNQPVIEQPRKSSRSRQASTKLKGSVVDKTTRKTLASNTRNVRKRR